MQLTAINYSVSKNNGTFKKPSLKETHSTITTTQTTYTTTN